MSGRFTGEEIVDITLVLPSLFFSGSFLKIVKFMSGRFTGDGVFLF